MKCNFQNEIQSSRIRGELLNEKETLEWNGTFRTKYKFQNENATSRWDFSESTNGANEDSNSETY